MITLLNALACEKGDLLKIGQGRRTLFATCKPEIKIYEECKKVSISGETGYVEKSIKLIIELRDDINFTSADVEEAMQTVERFELTADIMHDDGIVERFYFHNVSLNEINADDEWEFTLCATKEQTDRLLAMSGVRQSL